MENSWPWLTKCGSICHSSSSSSAAPSLEPPHNQIFHLHPPIQAKPTSSVHRLAPEAVNPWTSNFSSYSLGHTELDSSFLSLLSSPPHVSPNELPTCGSNASGCAAGSEISLLISGLLAQNLNSLNAETGVNLGLLVSPKSRVNECQGSSSTVNNVLQGAYPRLPKLQLPRSVIHQNLSHNENRMGLPSLNAGYVDGETLCNVWKTCTGNNAAVSQKIPLRTDSSVSCQSSNMLTGCPKVFCLGLSGDLLLSNTGLLGVLCSCHGLHMSISKFSEHSGLFCVNPGDAVQMDSGETISQWRKIYFLKLGIRTPEDHIGWDWPQGLSVTAGSSEHGLTLPSMSTNSDHCDQGCPPGASVQSMNPWSLLLHPKNSLTGKKAVAGFVHCEKQQSTKDCSSHFPKGRSNSSKNSLHFDAHNQMMGYSKPGSSTITNLLGLRGPYNVWPAISSYKDAIYKSGDSVDIATGKSVGSLVDVDTISSNVELRLGQPSQQSQTLGSSVIPASGSHSVVTHSQLQESLFLDQRVHKTGRSRSVKGNGQHIYLPGIMSTSSTRTEQNHFENVNYAFGVHTVPNASQIEHLKDNASRGSVTSELFANFRSPLQENNYCNSMNDAINDSHAMVSKPHSESSPSKSGQFGFPSFRGEATETKLCANVLCSQKCKKVDKVGCNIDSLHSTAELNMGSHAKSEAEMWNFSGVAGDTDRMKHPVLHDKGPNMYQFTGMMTDEPDTRNSLNYFGQVAYPDHIGSDKSNVFRTVSSPMNFGTILSSQAVSVGISATNSIAMKNLSPSCNKDNIGVSPYILDENLKMTAFQPRSVLSNQKIASGTSKTFPDPEGSRNCCGQPQGLVCSLFSDSRKNGFDFTTVPNASEVTRHPVLSANSTFRDTEKLPSVTGADKWCNCQVAAVSQGQYCPGKDTEIQCCLNSDLQPTRQFFLRFHGNENSTLSNEVGNCQEFPYGCFQSKFSCSSDSNCFTGRCDLMGEPSRREFREREGNAVNLVEPFRGPKLDETCTYADKDNSFGQKRLMVQNMKKAECNSFQWRDVPRKVVKDAIEVSKKCLEKSSHHAQKEHEISNISSGCSAPAVTQVSIEANNKDSSTVDGVDSDNLVVDEGSAIERCWSSDDDSERRSEFYGITSKTNLVNRRSSKSSVSKSSHGVTEELRFRDSLKVRRMQNKTNTSFPVQTKGNLLRKYERDSSKEKRRRVKWKRLYSSVSASSLPAALSGVSQSAGDAGLHSKDVQMLPQGDQQTFTGCPCSLGLTLKQKRPAFSSFDALSRKRELHRIHHIEVEDTDSETNLNAKSDYFKASEAIGRKRLRSVGATEDLEKDDIHDSACVVSEINAKVIGVDCIRTSKPANACHRRRRPVVCGKYGIISNANSLKPAKIVSLRTILKAARRCHIAESQKVNSISLKESKKASSNGKKEMKNDAHSIIFSQLNSQHSVEEKETAYSLNSKDSYDLSHIMKKRRHDGNKSHAILESSQNTQLRRKYKEVRKRSIYELTITENNSSSVKSHTMGDGRSLQIIKSRFVSKFAKNAGDDRMSADGIRYDGKCTKEDECRTSQVLDVVCCVCGSSDKDKSNCLLECSRCLIKVHQACYGVCKVPKAQWFCRPCKANSKNTVCVLCGYGGGAMTQALRSRNLVKSLLKAWSIESETHLQNPRFSKSLERPFNMLSSTKSVRESDPFLIIRPAHIESPSVALWNTDLSEDVDTVDITCATPPALCNSITAGILDSSVKQWVHMVCGLWTPGTRCPNVDTMSSFDVSGAYRPKQDVDCSICQRPGGSCIQCRVADCHVQFHPWCAHQKGLLQSEVEGIDNESVGFYGRCMLHAIYRQFNSDGYRSSNANHGQRECTCARTEGYKGRKRDGFHHNLPHHSDGSGCLVPQEQLNAWIHINGQKTCTRGPRKLPTSVIEYDCRKEYARYKQSRGWKHLVVYKSGIHGLGLYTSQFISRSAMVVEYVGEVVGLHVADKRETEYQAGKKVQYKSACYFFRIDKEHIIDATRKGGIARFVNHSCLPNCVAKVISVRNEKKVVFFAERDIYPGEEVTYDYHFNHEDEVRSDQTNCELHGVHGRPGMPSKVEYQLVQVSHMAYLDHVIPSLN